MASVLRTTKQIPASGYFTNVGSLAGAQGGATAAFLTNVGSDAAPQFSTQILAVSSAVSTMLATPGGVVLRDMGKTLVSSGRVFRKVQILSTFVNGTTVGGTANSGPGSGANPDFFTGYIELPSDANASNCAKVARLG